MMCTAEGPVGAAVLLGWTVRLRFSCAKNRKIEMPQRSCYQPLNTIAGHMVYLVLGWLQLSG